MNTNLKKKRLRGENWLEEDKVILKDLVKKRVRAIENKNTDTKSNVAKVVAWSDLKQRFNCMCRGSPRTVTQLKAQWGLLKLKAKRLRAGQSKKLPFDIVFESEDMLDPSTSTCVILNETDMLHPSTSTCEILNEMDMLHPSTSTCEILNETIFVDTEEAPSSPIPSVSPLLDPSLPPSPSNSEMQRPKPRQFKKKCFRSKCQMTKDGPSPAEQVAAHELECRRELHAIQMENEKSKNENLRLEAILIKHKIEYYKKKRFD